MRLAVVLLVVCAAWEVCAQTSTKIVGGTVTTIATYKFMVQLLQNSRPICGATLVSTTHVVTAAHCVEDSSVSSYSVKAGATYTGRSGGQVRVVATRWIHPQYNTNTVHADIAVLKLRSAVGGALIATIPLATALPGSSAAVRAIGWGLTSEGGSASSQLRHVTLPMVSSANCRKAYGNELTSTMFCAGQTGRDTCQGDSGGPLINAANQLVGIVSWGDGCARAGSPGVYTSVPITRSFILEKMRL